MPKRYPIELRRDVCKRLLAGASVVALIGEAVKQVTPELLETEPNVPWQSVAGMRDRLTHHYFDTSHAILQRTIDEDIPVLKDSLVRLQRGVGDLQD